MGVECLSARVESPCTACQLRATRCANSRACVALVLAVRRASVRLCVRAPVRPCIRASILACVCASVRPLSPARFSRGLPTLQTQVDRPCCVAVLPPSRCCPKAVCPGRAQPESRVCVRGLAYARADARRMQQCGAGRGASNALARGTLRAPGVVLGSQTWRLWCGWGARVCVGLTHAMTRDGAQNREKKRRRPSP